MTFALLLASVIASAAPVQAQPIEPAPAASAVPVGYAKVFADEDPPANWLQGNSSPRLAAPVVVRFDPAFQDVVPVAANSGSASDGSTNAASLSLSKHTPSVARRHFQEAKWTTGAGKGRELVIKSVAVTFSQGPNYRVQVVVDRVEDGRRLGQVTGNGSATADHSKDKARANWAPGPWGRAARNEASRPHLPDDNPVIAQATVRAVDQALKQLASTWEREDARKKK
ncbi:MAG: hypothetical protein QM765_26025 [Myxococcales bacterium]